VGRARQIIEAESPRNLLKRLAREVPHNAFLVRIDYERVNGERGTVQVPFAFTIEGGLQYRPFDVLIGTSDPAEFDKDQWNQMHEFIQMSIQEGDYAREFSNDEDDIEIDLETYGERALKRWSYQASEEAVLRAGAEAWRVYGEGPNNQPV